MGNYYSHCRSTIRYAVHCGWPLVAAIPQLELLIYNRQRGSSQIKILKNKYPKVMWLKKGAIKKGFIPTCL